MQLPMFSPSSAWRPPRLGELPSWAGSRRAGLDIESKDPHLKELGPGPRRPGSFVAGFSFAFEDGPKFYVPLRHEGGDNVEDPEQAIRYLRDAAREYRGEIVGTNMQYDLDFLAVQHKIEFPHARVRDVMIADPLICELHRSYSLAAIAQRWGFPGKDEALLLEAAQHFGFDAKRDLWRLPARFVGPYGTEDAALPLAILRRQEREIEKQDLWDIWNLESDLLPQLLRMRQRGVRVSEQRLEGIEQWSLAEEGAALAEVRHLTGVAIAVGDVWKAGCMAPALEAVGVAVPRTPKTDGSSAPSIDKDLLTAVAAKSPKDSAAQRVATRLSWARKTNKLRTTFAKSVREHMVNGRVHTTFNQLRRTGEFDEEGGAAYGRLSSTDPNMQQQPARDEFAKRWRSIYLPEEGAVWGALDYSQQEPRVLIHYAEVCELPGAFEAAERYRRDPKTDNHQMMSDMTGVPRKQAKELFLGKVYGMGGAKLCRKLGLPTRWRVSEGGHQVIEQNMHHGTSSHRVPLQHHYFETEAEARECAAALGSKANAFRGSAVWEVAGEAGQAIITQFDTRLPFVKELSQKCTKAAESKGYILTLGGRHCRFPKMQDGRYAWAHKALNRLIQGSSADQTKRAVVLAGQAGYFLQLQVHDEVDGSFGSAREAREVAEIMSTCYQMRVPFRVDIEIGPSWGEAEELKEAA